MSNPGYIFTQKKCCGKLNGSNRACQILGCHFHKQNKKTPAPSWLAATGLVKSKGGHFRRKKSPCGNSTKQHRACQVSGQSWGPVQNTKFGAKWVENQPFGLKIGSNESHGLSGPIWTSRGAKKSATKKLPKQTSIFGGSHRPASRIHRPAPIRGRNLMGPVGSHQVASGSCRQGPLDQYRSTRVHRVIRHARPVWSCTSPDF